MQTQAVMTELSQNRIYVEEKKKEIVNTLNVLRKWEYLGPVRIGILKRLFCSCANE